MKFTCIGDVRLTVNEARWYRSHLDDVPGLTMEFSRDDYDAELTRHYPIRLNVHAYEISRVDFEELKDLLALYPTDTQTMGIIGGDGDIGWTPAMNWECDGAPDMFGSIYVTPWPETVRPITRGHSWERVVSALMSHYS